MWSPSGVQPAVFENEIYTRFDVAVGQAKSIEIPMPGTPGLHNIKELVLLFGDNHTPASVDLLIEEIEFSPVRLERVEGATE